MVRPGQKRFKRTRRTATVIVCQSPSMVGWFSKPQGETNIQQNALQTAFERIKQRPVIRCLCMSDSIKHGADSLKTLND